MQDEIIPVIGASVSEQDLVDDSGDDHIDDRSAAKVAEPAPKRFIAPYRYCRQDENCGGDEIAIGGEVAEEIPTVIVWIARRTPCRPRADGLKDEPRRAEEDD